MSVYEIQFSKEGRLKYISHLDMMRLFRRAFKRAGLDLVYSNGFNPHPKISLAVPLPLGFTSVAEMMDVETIADYAPEVLQEKLQEKMPQGIGIINCIRADRQHKKNLAARCTKAKYAISLEGEKPLDTLISPEDGSRFLALDEILIEKWQKKKKSYRQINVRHMIHQFALVPVANGDESVYCNVFISTVLDAGSQSNLNPQLLIDAFLAWKGLDEKNINVEIQRQNLYFEE